jgi:glycosyltransferase involved in cell wall biosynthesis
LLLDLSPVGSNPLKRTGLARVALELARALSIRPDLDVKCCAWGSIFASHDFSRFLSTQNSLKGYGCRLSKVDQLYAGVWSRYSDRRQPVPWPWLRIGQLLNVCRNPLKALDWDGIDVIHSTFPRFHRTLGRCQKPRVLTIHDLTPLRLPPTLVPAAQRVMMRRLFASVAPEDWISCVSENTRKDFLEHTGHPPGRTRVIYNGVNTDVFRPRPVLAAREFLHQRCGLRDKPFVMTLSSLAPHKNLAMLMKIWPRLRRSVPDAQLVIGGGKDESIEELYQRLQLTGEVCQGANLTGYLTDDEFAALCSACQTFLFPSLYEGFGLPVLEAMACGAPVIASRSGSIAEVVDRCGTLLDPNDEESWITHIGAALASGLRSGPVTDNLERAATFTWSAAADQYRQLYQEATMTRIS